MELPHARFRERERERASEEQNKKSQKRITANKSLQNEEPFFQRKNSPAKGGIVFLQKEIDQPTIGVCSPCKPIADVTGAGR